MCAFTVGEEGRGDLRSARAVVADLAPFALLAVEGHFGERLATRAVGSTRLEARMRGPGGHSWGDRGRPSAVHGMARAAAVVADIPRSADASVSVGLIGGGTSINALAAEAWMELDLRAVEDPEELAALEERARATIAASAAREGVEAQVREIGRRPAGRLDPADPLRDELLAVQAAVGRPVPDESPVSTDANAALLANVPRPRPSVSPPAAACTPPRSGSPPSRSARVWSRCSPRRSSWRIVPRDEIPRAPGERRRPGVIVAA